MYTALKSVLSYGARLADMLGDLPTQSQLACAFRSFVECLHVQVLCSVCPMPLLIHARVSDAGLCTFLKLHFTDVYCAYHS